MGLDYLHKRSIIHGDLKGVRLSPQYSSSASKSSQCNILVTNETPAHACLADFGLSTLTPSTLGGTTTNTTGGTRPYMAPELLAPEKFGMKNRRPTQPADIYAFGMVIYEVLTGRDPFYDQKCGQYQFMANVLDGKRPTKPADVKTVEFGSGTWELAEECWREQLAERPATERVLEHLARVAASSIIVGPTPKMPYNSSDDSLEFNPSSTVPFAFSNHHKPHLYAKGRLSQPTTVTALPTTATALPTTVTAPPIQATIPSTTDITPPVTNLFTPLKGRPNVNAGAQVLNPGDLCSPSSVSYDHQLTIVDAQTVLSQWRRLHSRDHITHEQISTLVDNGENRKAALKFEGKNAATVINVIDKVSRS